jgi:hypothetical protein
MRSLSAVSIETSHVSLRETRRAGLTRRVSRSAAPPRDGLFGDSGQVAERAADEPPFNVQVHGHVAGQVVIVPGASEQDVVQRLLQSFCGAELRAVLAHLLDLAPEQLSAWQMTYHLRRLRRQGLIEGRSHQRRYQVTPQGRRLVLFRTRALNRLQRPGLAQVLSQSPPRTRPSNVNSPGRKNAGCVSRASTRAGLKPDSFCSGLEP